MDGASKPTAGATKTIDEVVDEKSSERSREEAKTVEALTELDEAVASPNDEEDKEGDSPPTSHARQPSLSVQSKMRSSSFRQGPQSQAPLSPTFSASGKPLSLPPLSPEGGTMTEIYRKQAARLEQLEKDNRRLDKELQLTDARRKKAEEEVEDLRDAKGEVVALQERAHRAQQQEETLEKLVRSFSKVSIKHLLTCMVMFQRSEVTSLQRQNAHLQSQNSKSSRRISSVGLPQHTTTTTNSSELEEALRSKSTTIESMELEISNLQARLNEKLNASIAEGEQVSALETNLERSEKATELSRLEVIDLKRSLERMRERAVKEGSQHDSAENKIRTLEARLDEGARTIVDVRRQHNAMDKKLSALTAVHKDLDTRHLAVLRERDLFEKEAAALRHRLGSMLDKSIPLGSTRESAKTRIKEASATKKEGDAGDAGTDGDTMVDPVDEDRHHQLQIRVRQLEGELFEMKRGAWKRRRQGLGEDRGEDVGVDDEDLSPGIPGPGNHNNFDDVDLGSTTSPSRGGARASKGGPSLKDRLFNDGFFGLTRTGPARTVDRDGGNDDNNNNNHHHHHNDDYDHDEDDTKDMIAFDEDGFRRAQEDEAKRRVERVRETKRKLKDWIGWRLDLVDARMMMATGGGVGGGHGGSGEIFDV